MKAVVPAPTFLHFTVAAQAIRRFMHAHISTNAPPDVRTANHLIIMHAKRGHLHLAHQWFAQMPHKNIFSWTILISAYSQHGKLDQCFGLFSHMLSHHRPNDFAYSSLLSVCDYWHGVQVHGLALKTSFDAWIYVANALMAMYWNNSCNAGVEAWRVFEAMDFRNLVTYNSMITGLSMHKQGLALDIGVVTALIRGYSILVGEVDACHKLFLETSSMDRDVVLWNEIMMASAEREPEQTLFLFKRMLGEDLFPDCYIFSVVLKACSNLVAEGNASALHCQVITAGFLNVLELGNALIHAYARCGSIDNAEQVFFEMSLRDIVSWNSVLKAYAVHGKAETALGFFKQMDVAPDGTTFVAVLSSCSHAGMVKEGTKIFDTMYEKYGITPQLDHYACMVDILGRAGHLSEAENIIKKMPMQPDHVIWSALLAACRKHGETKLANVASSKLKELDPENSLGYVLISNIYCSANSFDEADSVRMKMNRAGVRKEPGLSWIEIRHRMHEFASGGAQHSQIKAIRANMEKLLGQLKKMGYVPETSSVLFDVEEEHKEEQLYHHSEKLALVFFFDGCCRF
ncbi:UNVERIFIED_CONTAM: Pentatricopeptide repeat-containing protein [Sesamum angustifolium]|uniref:Pentatricopeptide repeat-containing protein n=1 Tax=Sesamum angustifolium TaxID=2727405 RepID=A0AAW2MSM0_9LAMI